MSNDFDRLPVTNENRPIAISSIFFAANIILVAWLHLATPFLTVLFCYFVIKKLHFSRSKVVALVLFLFVVSLSFYAFVVFVKHALRGLPEIADTSIPKVLAFAQLHDIELPFEDVDALKALVM